MSEWCAWCPGTQQQASLEQSEPYLNVIKVVVSKLGENDFPTAFHFQMVFHKVSFFRCATETYRPNGKIT